MKRPSFIIIGAMKCATTTLHEQLAQQPGIFMSEPKEPNFFSNDEEYAKGLDWYGALFAEASENDLCGESSTHYTKLPTYPHTLERIQQHLPNARFIYVMRHPIERLVSQYIHEWSERTVDGDINQALLTFEPLIQYSRYSYQLKPYLEAFGRDRVLPVFTENLKRFPQQELERVCQFIGYAGAPQWQTEVGSQHASAERLRANPLRDAVVDQPLLQFLRRMLVPKSLRTWVRGFWQMKKRPELTIESQQYLATVFDEDLHQLGLWLDLDLTCQTFKDVVATNTASFAHWDTYKNLARKS